ncbi:MAG: hypothetical protein IT380_05785 [Myxococcales bacterium]|nr:hypothetical protein [Myxococcales bacterium]
MSPLVLLAVVGALDLVGPPLRQDGYQLRPPRQFRMARMDLYHGTRVATVTRNTQAARYLSAALMDGDGEDAATMMISIVEEPLTLGPSSRDEASTAVLRHFRDELELPFVLERADVRTGASARVEVLGSVREGSQLRRILVAAWPGEVRHVVVLFSVPSGRWEPLKAALDESLESVRPDIASGPSRSWRWAFATFILALLALSIGLWRRRQQRLR